MLKKLVRAIRMVKEELRLPTVLGVSNISYGLPDRSLINATFLSMAMAEGLDAAIMNPGDPMMMETVRAASVLTVRDKDSKAFVETYKKKRKITKKGDAKSLTSAKEDNKISVAVMRGNREEIGVLVKEAIASGKTAQEINSEILIPAIREVGEQYDRKEIYLPQMILAAETMQKAFEVLEPHFRAREAQNAGKVLICTVKGDVHDIGKNIVALFLKNHGFHVIDLGKDVPTDTIIKKTLEHQPDVVGLSALMTTTMVEMPVIIQQLKKRGITARVVVGGAVVTKQFAKEIGADDYAKDGVSAVEKVKAMVDKT
jgi:5-methyltetrahydrofolate--homocysteine methyltransferase